MSTHFTAYCQPCDEAGPVIRRGAGGTGLQGPLGDEGDYTPSQHWARWFETHQWCGPTKLYSEHVLRANYGVDEVNEACIAAAVEWREARQALVAAMKTMDDDPDTYNAARSALGLAEQALLSALRRVS